MRLHLAAVPPYIDRMQTIVPDKSGRLAVIATVALVFAAVSGVAFAAWADKSGEIFLTLTQSGLNWCL